MPFVDFFCIFILLKINRVELSFLTICVDKQKIFFFDDSLSIFVAVLRLFVCCLQPMIIEELTKQIV